MASLDALAELRLRDPPSSLEGAEAILAEVEREIGGGDGDARDAVEVQAKALTVVGLAHHYLGDLKQAVDCYQQAIDVSRTAGLVAPEAVARACLGPSKVSLGDAARAEQEIDRAEALATSSNRGFVGFCHAVVLQRTGRLLEASAIFARAIPWLEEVDDQPTLALAYSNWAVLLSYQGDLAQALQKLAAAEAIERRRDLRLLLAMDTHNMGFTLGRLGRLPDALAAFDRAEQAYSALGNPKRQVAVLQADRCEALLLAGMVGEALAAGQRAVDALVGIGDLAHLMECRVLLAQAHLAGGDYAAAAAEAAEAARGFTDASRPPWAALAHYVEIQADILATQDVGLPPPGLLERCRDLAAALDAEGWPTESVHVRTFAGRVALALGRADVAREELALAAPARHRGTADMRARAWLAMALLRLAEGDRGRAKRALSQGFSVIEHYLASLGATELRVNAASHGADLARTGVRLALEDRRAAEVLRWAERWRARALARPPVRPPDDEQLATDLAELRIARSELRQASLNRPTGPAEALIEAGPDRALAAPSRAVLLARVAELERSIRSRTLQAIDRDPARTGRIDLHGLRDALDERWLVEFVTSDNVLYAVTVTRNGTRLYRLGHGSIDEEKQYLLFALRRLHGMPGRSGGRQSLAATAARLDAMLFAPLQIPEGVPVVVVPTGTLHGLPWPALPTLAGRSTTVAPSAAIWLGGTGIRPATSPAPGRGLAGAHSAAPATPARPEASAVTLIAGPHLPQAADEIRQLAALYPRARCLTNGDATAPAVLAAMQQADVAHLAAHGTFRSDSPMFSSVLLADGPLNVYDLERLRRGPTTVVVAACDAAVNAVRHGDGLLGTGAALIGLGVRSVVAPVMPVPDHSTAPVMVALHRRLIAGDPPAQALAAAQDDQDPAVGAAFVCIGCNDRLSRSPAQEPAQLHRPGWTPIA